MSVFAKMKVGQMKKIIGETPEVRSDKRKPTEERKESKERDKREEREEREEREKREKRE